MRMTAAFAEIRSCRWPNEGATNLRGASVVISVDETYPYRIEPTMRLEGLHDAPPCHARGVHAWRGRAGW